MKFGPWLKQVGPPVAVLAASMVGAELLVALRGVPAWLVPPPSRVLQAIWEHRQTLGVATAYTAMAAGAGFVLASLAGMAAGVCLGSARWVQRAFYPYAVFFQTVPIVAIAPLLVIWFGWGVQTAVVSALIVAVFPVIANTLAGLRATDPALVDLFKLYGAGWGAMLWKLRLPAALPSIFTGLRVAAGLAVIGAIVAEFFVRQGLGSEMKTAIQEQRTDIVFAGVLLAAGLGLTLFGLVNLAAHLCLRRWHASEAT